MEKWYLNLKFGRVYELQTQVWSYYSNKCQDSILQCFFSDMKGMRAEANEGDLILFLKKTKISRWNGDILGLYIYVLKNGMLAKVFVDKDYIAESLTPIKCV